MPAKIIKPVLNSVKIYIWMLPALLLLFFFLIKPAFETFILSLHQEVKISETQIRNELIQNLSAKNNNISDKDIFKNTAGWDAALRNLNAAYHIKVNPDDIDETMTIRETAELYIITIYEMLERKGNLEKFVGLHNYIQMFHDPDMIKAFKNNLLWLFLFTFLTVSFGLLLAKLMGSIPWSMIAKSIIFIPMAISYVASGVIWSFMYAKDIHIGTINALLNIISRAGSIFGLKPYHAVAFLGNPETVNYALIAAGIWVWSGFCVVVFTAALNGIPEDIIEVSKIDGANALQTFFKIEIPMIFPSILVVITTMVINVLKVFDIVYTMTGGGPFGSSEVIANRMYRTAFNVGNTEYASAMAVILFLAIIPIMIFNIKHFLTEATNKS